MIAAQHGQKIVDALHEPDGVAIGDAYYALVDRDGEDSTRPLATLYAALDDAGWSGDAADTVVAFVANGPTRRAMNVGRRESTKFDAPWAQWDDVTPEIEDAVKGFRRFLRRHSPWPADDFTLDLDAPAEAPRWLVPGFLERGRVHMLSGPTHAFKSGLREHQIAASVTGTPFLGREIEPLRWLVIDAENSRSDVRRNLRACGVRNRHMDAIRVIPREAGVALGEDRWNERFRQMVADHRPDVVEIDTIVRACSGVNSLDADSVAGFYRDVLVPLVDDFDLALRYSIHWRKSGGRKGTDEAVSGSGQWSGQAEMTMTVDTTDKAIRLDPQSDGTTNTARRFVLHRPKGRTLTDSAPEPFLVSGVLGPDEELLSRRVDLPSSSPAGTTAEDRLLDVLVPSALGTTAWARAAGFTDYRNSGFRAARKALEDTGRVAKNGDGLHEKVAAD